MRSMIRVMPHGSLHNYNPYITLLMLFIGIYSSVNFLHEKNIIIKV